MERGGSAYFLVAQLAVMVVEVVDNVVRDVVLVLSLANHRLEGSHLQHIHGAMGAWTFGDYNHYHAHVRA